MKMYKWFIWSWKLRRYMAIPGLFPYSRGKNPAVMVTPHDCIELPPTFCVPMFNTHNAAK